MQQPDRLKPHVLALLSLLFGTALLWPAFLNGGPLLFFDSFGYLDQGRQAVEGALALLRQPSPAKAAGAAGFEAAASSATYIRSLSWSGYAYVTSETPLGLFGPVLMQSVLVAALILLLLAPAAGNRLLFLFAAFALLAAFTTLPWFASYMMPDILAAVLILAGMLVVQQASMPTRHPMRLAFITLAATFAVASHYGFVPLGVAVAAAVLIVLVLERRLTPVLAIAAVAPVLIAVVATMAASEVAFDSPDVTPKRFPILLARSIEDGPALWYLEKVCPEAGYVLCPYVAEMPTSVGGVLWGPDSLVARLSDEEREALRAEEVQILIGAFRTYPLQQSWALIGNGVRQLATIGMDDVHWGHAVMGADGKLRFGTTGHDRAGLEELDRVHAIVVVLSLLIIVAFVLKDRLRARPDERGLFFILLAGLLANAAIFGGLSVPVDRYQARIIWLLPLLAILFVINRLRPATP